MIALLGCASAAHAMLVRLSAACASRHGFAAPEGAAARTNLQLITSTTLLAVREVLNKASRLSYLGLQF